MKFFDFGAFIFLAVLIAGNGLQFQADYDRCKASDFKESKCELHKKNYERSLKK